MSYFEEDGLVLNFIEEMQDIYQGVLEDMDTNNDDKVSKEEFHSYMKSKFCNNEKIADCCVSCCFPILSSGKKNIKVDKN